MADLPQGFVLDQPPQVPQGFKLDAPTGKADTSDTEAMLFQAIPEAGMQLATSAIAQPVSGIGGLLSMLIPGAPPAGDVVRSIQDKMTYEPRSQQGRELVPNLMEDVINATPELIKRPMAGAAQKYSQLEQWAADNYGPAAGAAVATLPTALLEAIPAGLALKKMRAAGAAAPEMELAGPPKAPEGYAAKPTSTELPQEVVTPENLQQLGKTIKTEKPQAIAPEVKPDAQILKDAEALGIDLNPAHYSTSRAYMDMEAALKSRPGSMLSQTEEKAIIELGNRADDLIRSMGGTTDKSVLDMTLKDEFGKVVADLESQSDVLYKKVEATIPRATKVKPTNSWELIDQQLADLGGNEKLLTSAEKQVRELATGDDNPTYAALDRIRRNIGDAIGKRSGIYKEDDAGKLKRLYAALAEDQQKAAEAFGIGNEYRDASNLVKLRKDIEDKSVSLFGKEASGSIIPKIRQSAGGLSKGDIASFHKMISAVPEGRRQEVAATMLNDLFSSGSRRDRSISQGFVDTYSALNRNKSAKDALFSYLPVGSQERFDMIGRVATGIYRSKALENNSRTARDVIAAMDNAGMFTKLYEVGKKAAAAEGVSTTMGLPGIGTAATIGNIVAKAPAEAAKRADELLASPAFRDAVKDYALGAADKAERRIMLTPEYKAWLDAQNKTVRHEVMSMGLIPWLTQKEEIK